MSCVSVYVYLTSVTYSLCNQFQPGADVPLQEIFDRIRVAVHKNGIRTTEFLKDYDRHNDGVITEHQFVCGVHLAVGKEAQLSREELQKIVEFYRTEDGRVQYKEFCAMLENGNY